MSLDDLAADAPVVTCEWLLEHLDDPRVVVAEISQEADPSGYLAGHVPGARGWWWKDVVWDDHEREFPEPAEMAARLGELGVADGQHLVLYAPRNQFATYCYWVMTELCGLDRVHVLDGGKQRWQHLDYPLVQAAATVRPGTRTATAAARDDRSRIRRDTLLAAVTEGTAPRLVDARSEEEYAGRRVKPGPGLDHGAERHGRIPGAVSLPYSELFADDGSFRTAEELRERFARVGAGPQQADDVVAYCRLGHRGSLVWFVTTRLLGWDHVRVYDGSWTEWGSMVGVPVER